LKQSISVAPAVFHINQHSLKIILTTPGKIHIIAFLENDFQNLLISLNKKSSCIQFFKRLLMNGKSLRRGNAGGF
jgi:hypothetical protein